MLNPVECLFLPPALLSIKHLQCLLAMRRALYHIHFCTAERACEDCWIWPGERYVWCSFSSLPDEALRTQTPSIKWTQMTDGVQDSFFCLHPKCFPKNPLHVSSFSVSETKDMLKLYVYIFRFMLWQCRAQRSTWFSLHVTKHRISGLVATKVAAKSPDGH